jgi:hypothetical protein
MGQTDAEQLGPALEDGRHMKPVGKQAARAKGHDQKFGLMTRDWLIIASELVMFSTILAVIWLDEYIDLPALFLGAPPVPYRMEEYLLESSLILISGLFVMVITFLLLRRYRRLEHFLKVCAWCKKVWINGTWVNFEDYALSRYSQKSSHGICDECRAGMRIIKKKRDHTRSGNDRP